MLSECKLCPRECKVNRLNGGVGFCGAGAKAKIARAALHLWEEPCISGNEGSGTVFFSCCNMKCVYCQNYGISTLNRGMEVSEEELAERFIGLQAERANNINLVTPTHFIPQIINALSIAKERGLHIPIVYNCGGYESVETLGLLSGYVDIYMPDMKYYKDKYAIEFSSAPNYFEVAKNAIAEMFSQTGKPQFNEKGIMQKGVSVRHMMLPGLMFDTKKIIDYLYEAYGDDIYISLMSQYTPMPNVSENEKLNRRISTEYYDAMVEYCAEKGIRNAFIQDGSSATESFIPEFNLE